MYAAPYRAPIAADYAHDGGDDSLDNAHHGGYDALDNRHYAANRLLDCGPYRVEDVENHAQRGLNGGSNPSDELRYEVDDLG